MDIRKDNPEDTRPANEQRVARVSQNAVSQQRKGDSGKDPRDTRPEHTDPGYASGGDLGDQHFDSVPEQFRRSDEAIRRDVADHLTAHPETSAAIISVGVMDGRVTLSGSVERESIARSAERIAKGVLGVTTIENHLGYGNAS